MEELVILVVLITSLISFIIACLILAKLGQVEEAFIDMAEVIEDMRDDQKTKMSYETIKGLHKSGVSDKDIEDIQQKFSNL